MESDDTFTIQKWLKSVLGDGDYQYEGNKRSLGILKQLMVTNIDMDSGAKVRLADLKQKAVEYQQESECNKTILGFTGLAPDLLSETGLNSLKTLVKLAEKLQLGQAPGYFSDSTYMMALCHLRQNLSQLQQANADQKRILFNMKIDSKSESQMLVKIVSNLDEKLKTATSNAEEELKMMKYFNSKNSSYKTRVMQKNKHLSKIGARSSIHHGILSKISTEVSELQSTIKELQKKLWTYEKLPPSLSMLNIKVAEKEVEMAHLEEKLNLLFNQADSQKVL